MTPQMVTLMLSDRGLEVLGHRIFEFTEPVDRTVSGALVDYDREGVWFQDTRLSKQNKMVLVKWSFIDAIVSEMQWPEVPERKSIGFRAADLITGE